MYPSFGHHPYLQVSKPIFFITTLTAEEVPSCSVPKSMLVGRSWKPLTTAFGSVREMVRHFLLTGSSTDRYWNEGHRQSDMGIHVWTVFLWQWYRTKLFTVYGISITHIFWYLHHYRILRAKWREKSLNSSNRLYSGISPPLDVTLGQHTPLQLM